MKIGCCTNMIATGPDKTGIEFTEALAALGFDYVELPLAELTALSTQAFDSLAQRVEVSGIRCETCNNFFPKTIRLTGDGVNTTEIDIYVEKALSRAKGLGVDYVVFGSGPAKNVPDGFPREVGYRQVVEMLQRIAPMAEQQGIGVVIEPLRSAECNLINSFAQGCALAKDVDRENVKVLVDYYHLTEEQEPVEHIATMGGDYLRHVHFARYDGRSYPVNAGEDRGYESFFNALAAAGYKGRISLEAYTSDFLAQAPAALAFLRKQTQLK